MADDFLAWQAVQDQIGEAMAVFPLISKALSVARIRLSRVGLDAQTLRATFRWANRIRARYTCSTFWKARKGSTRQ